MNDNEKLYNAITQIDDSLVDEAAGYEKSKPAPKYVRLIYAAAALLLILGAAFAVSRIIKKASPRQEAAFPSEQATEPASTEAPELTDMPNNVPKPDPIVPGTKAYSLRSVVTEWYQSTGGVGLALFENGEQILSLDVTQRSEFSKVARAFDGYLDTLYVYVKGEDFTSETEGSARRIDLTGGGAVLSVWEGTDYVRYVKDDFTRWFLLDGYTGLDHGSEFLFDELMRGIFADQSEARAETCNQKDARASYDLHDDTIIIDGVWMMESPDEPGVYLPIVDRSEEFMQIFTETGKSGELLEFEERFIAARNELRKSRLIANYP